jgi:hypothetical protein
MVIRAGDYIKAEFEDPESGERERMWVSVEWCDEDARIALGRLDGVPVLRHGGKLKLGSQLAVSYENILERRTAAEFEAQ